MNAVCKGRTFRYVVDMLGVSVDACSPCSFIHTTSRRGDVVRSLSIADSLLHTQQDVARRNEAKRLASWRKTRRRVPCVCVCRWVGVCSSCHVTCSPETVLDWSRQSIANEALMCVMI